MLLTLEVAGVPVRLLAAVLWGLDESSPWAPTGLGGSACSKVEGGRGAEDWGIAVVSKVWGLGSSGLQSGLGVVLSLLE